MPTYNYGPGLVVNDQTMAIVASASGDFYDAPGGTIQSITDLTDTPLAHIITNASGFFPSFRTATGPSTGWILFGTYWMPVTSVEAQNGAAAAASAASSASAAQASATSAAAAVTTIQTAVPTGGSTGQVLAKVSATDYATAWRSVAVWDGTETVLDGTVPPAGTPIATWTRSVVQTTDASGIILVNFGGKFPNGLVNLMAVGGGSVVGTAVPSPTGSTKSAYNILVRNPAGTAIASGSVRVNIAAWGW